VAQSIGVSRPTVWRCQQRFCRERDRRVAARQDPQARQAPIAAETAARVVAKPPDWPRTDKDRKGDLNRMVSQGGPALKLSVIIANYNHRNFVGAAIESALAVDWPHKEVIVVDDASTDDSRSVIDGFRGRVTAYFRPKSHQLGAHIFGFEKSTGDVIIFLDADDLLEPEVMQEVVKVWRSGVSQIQYRMNLIDSAGTQLGTAIPQFPQKNDPARLRRNYLRTITYTTPPGSGSAYARDFVARAYAIPKPPTIRWSDHVLHPLAPILGDVLTIRKPLARYRIHAANGGMLGSLDAGKLRYRLQEDVEKARVFASASQQFGLPAPHDPLRHNLTHLQPRLASYLIEPEAHPFPEDKLWSLICRLMYSAVMSSQMRVRDRVILVTWSIGCVLAPPNTRRNLVLWRFNAISRPQVIKSLLAVLSSLQSPRLPDRS
jgi:glycosyltransferase involved in cell wall biosynthesis